MKGVIWKYLAETDASRDLEDDTVRTRCSVDNPDPDFWEHKFPIWSVCGPVVRPTLEEGDVLFFTPTLVRGGKAGVPDYTCTAYLTVGRVVKDSKAFLRDPAVTDRYKRNYASSLRRHPDAGIVRTLRRQNIIIGDPQRSDWLGKSGPPLPEVLRKLGMYGLTLNRRRVRNLTRKETERLRAFLARMRGSE